jgi:16S rRNA (cytosine1407-C5)-methyltransferase
MSNPRNTEIPSLPDAFVQRIRQQFPDEHKEFITALNLAPGTSIRLNPHKWERIRSRPSPPGEPVPWSRNGRYLHERPSFTHDPLFHAGSYYVQEASSMFLEHVLAGPGSVYRTAPADSITAGTTSVPYDSLRTESPGSAVPFRPPVTILDACAAPGGKTTLLAALFPDALVAANEVIRSRVPSLLENSIKWGTGNIVVTQNDPSHFRRLPGFFDLILADVPCSGEGLFRKDPAARREWSPENARHCAMRQRSILTELWPALRPGGLLVYTTCTFNPDENERNLAWLMEQTGGESVRVDAVSSLTRLPSQVIREIKHGGATGYAFHPHISAGEGFFLGVLHKPDSITHHDNNISSSDTYSTYYSPDHDAYYQIEKGSPESYPSPAGRHAGKRSRHGKTRRKSSGSAASGPHELTQPDPSILTRTDKWFTGDNFEWYQLGDRLFRIRSGHLPLLRQFVAALSVRHAGIEVGRVIRDEVIPSPAAAFDIHLDHSAFPVMDLSREEAIRYLRRENLPVPPDAPAGWNLVVHDGLALGWTKNIGRRMNNYYPAEWRIRK